MSGINTAARHAPLEGAEQSGGRSRAHLAACAGVTRVSIPWASRAFQLRHRNVVGTPSQHGARFDEGFSVIIDPALRRCRVCARVATLSWPGCRSHAFLCWEAVQWQFEKFDPVLALSCGSRASLDQPEVRWADLEEDDEFMFGEPHADPTGSSEVSGIGHDCLRSG